MLVYKNIIANVDVFDAELHNNLLRIINSIFFWIKPKENKASIKMERFYKKITQTRLLAFIKSKCLISTTCLLSSNYILRFISLLLLVTPNFLPQFIFCKRTLILHNE